MLGNGFEPLKSRNNKQRGELILLPSPFSLCDLLYPVSKETATAQASTGNKLIHTVKPLSQNKPSWTYSRTEAKHLLDSEVIRGGAVLTHLHCRANPSVLLSRAELYLCRAPTWSEQEEKLHGEKVAWCLCSSLTEKRPSRVNVGIITGMMGSNLFPPHPRISPWHFWDKFKCERCCICIVSQRW